MRRPVSMSSVMVPNSQFQLAALMTRPLDGVRILDLTRLLPGAYATLLLADLGADVIKLEDPRGGDHARRMPPLANGTSVYFQVLNRNKRSVTLDLRSPAAAAVLDALVSASDVVVDSFRPRTAARLGVDGRHPPGAPSAARVRIDHGIRSDGPVHRPRGARHQLRSAGRAVDRAPGTNRRRCRGCSWATSVRR